MHSTSRRWTSWPMTMRLASMLTFLSVMVASFLVTAIQGADWRILVTAVLICVAIVILWLIRHVWLGLFMMVFALAIGWGSDYWAVMKGYWTYQGLENSFWVVHADAPAGGVPFEIVIAYACAAIWITQVIESLFDREVTQMKAISRGGSKLSGRRWHIVALLLMGSVAVIDPRYIQPLTIFLVGGVMTLFLPEGTRHVPAVFGSCFAVAGLFFESLSTGKLVSGAALWIFLEVGHSGPQWVTGVLIGYGGAGVVFASAVLLLSRLPVFSRTTEILPHPEWVTGDANRG